MKSTHTTLTQTGIIKRACTNLCYTCFLILSSSLCTSSFADAEPPLPLTTAPKTNNFSLAPFTHYYKLKHSKSPLKIKAVRSLKELQNGQYRIELNAKTLLAKSSEFAEFSWKNCTSTPNQYSYYRKGFGKKKTNLIEFNWAKKQATSHYKKQQYTYPLTPDTMDKISQAFSIQCLLSKGHPEMSFTVAEKNKTKVMRYIVNGQETISTSIGSVNAIKVSRIHRNPERSTSLWFATDHNYTLIKMIQTQDNATLQLTIYKDF